MTIRTFFKILRKRARTFVIVLLLALAGACAITLALPKTYSASATTFIGITSVGNLAGSQHTPSADTGTLAQNSQFALNRVGSYLEMAHSPEVLTPVVHDLGLHESYEKLDDSIAATNPSGTVLITLTATSGKAKLAKDIANAATYNLGKRIESVETPEGSKASLVKATVAVPAKMPTSPVSPKPALNLLLGLVLGLALGATLVVALEQMDTTVKTNEDVQAITGQSPIGFIGSNSAFKERPLVVTHPSGATLEDFRSLRANLLFVDAVKPARVIVVSSAVAGEGKSVTTCNLAITLAQGGRSVCVVDADLRRPKAMEHFGVDGSVGLTNVVSGQHPLEDVLVSWNRGQVTLLPGGPTPPDPGQLLGSAPTAEVLQSLRQRFDFVLIDAPPLLPVSDAAVLSHLADGVVLVVRHGHLRREQLQALRDTLVAANARIIGIILSQVPDKTRRGTYGYGTPAPSGRHLMGSDERARDRVGEL